MKIKTYLTKNAVNQEIDIAGKLNVSCNLCESTTAGLIVRENEFNICKCVECGLVYIKPQPSPEDLNGYYAEYYPEITETTVADWEQRRSFNQAKKVIEKYYPDGGDLLDLGCGLGLFIESLDHIKWNSVGLDLSEKAIEFASGRNRNISFICGDIFDSNIISDNSFDVVTILACLEHLSDPKKTLKRIYQVLKPGGRAVFRVPYIEPWLHMKKYLPFLPLKFQAPMHMYDFSSEVLKKYLGKTGYMNIEISIASPDRYSGILTKMVVYSIKSISQLLNFISGRRYIFPLAGGLIGIGQKNNISD